MRYEDQRPNRYRSAVEYHAGQGCDIRHRTYRSLDRCQEQIDRRDERV